MEQEKGKLRLPVEVDDDGFTIDESRLDESLTRRIEELANQKVSDRNQKRREVVAIAASLCVMGVSIGLLFTKAFILGVAFLMIFIMELGNVVKWVEGNEKRS